MNRTLIVATLSVLSLSSTLASPPAASAVPAIDADAALALLKDGNARFAAGESTFPNLDQDRRCFTTDGGQHPYASVLSCSDSRVPPELIFDAGIGELFTIRVAGNVADTDEIGTLEYGAGHLHTPLIVVMGHTRCGAVTAVAQGATVHGSIPKLVDNIAPAVETAREKHAAVPESKFIPLAIKENVRQSMADVLRGSDEIRGLVAEGKVTIVGAVYDIHNGTIEWLGELPNQAALLEGSAGHDNAHHEPSRSAAHSETDTHAKPASYRAAPTAHGNEDDHSSKVAEAKSDHGAPASKRKSTAPDASHAAPASHDDGHAPRPNSDRKGAQPSKHEDAAHGDDAHATAEKAQSLVQKHGLLVPAVFLAAGSALSGTVVFLLKGRSAAQAKAEENDEAEESKPAEAKGEH